MSDAAAGGREASVPRRCTHCGRHVNETTHTRESWRVDYYRLHTGEVEPATITRDDVRGPITYLKLVTVEEVITCVECYRDPSVREERDERFHPERRVEAVP